MPKGHPKGEPHRWVPFGGTGPGDQTPLFWQCHCGAQQKKRPEPRGTRGPGGKIVRKMTDKNEWRVYAPQKLVESGKWSRYIKTAPIMAKQMDKAFRVKTKEGKVSGKAGDYLCLGVENEMWPVDRTIFEKTMKRVDSVTPKKLREAHDLSTANLASLNPKELKLLQLRLFGKALKAFPSSPRQKAIHAELEKVAAEIQRRGLTEIIRKHGSGYRLVSHKGKNLGDFPTKAGAEKHEREVQYFKHESVLSEATLYHVTHTKLVPKIQQKGLLPLQPSNWKKGSGERYGQAGEVFAFTDLSDAIRWAAKMDWDFNQGTGTGKISILTLDSTKEKWDTDTADPMSQAGIKGRWVKTIGRIPPEQIKKVTPLTVGMVKSLIATRNKGE